MGAGIAAASAAASTAAGYRVSMLDAVLGKPVGLPPTRLFGLIDLIGLDVMDLVGKNLAKHLPADDIGRSYTELPSVEREMLKRGQLGRKARELGGFARVCKLDDGSKTKETFDLRTAEWRPAVEAEIGSYELGEILFDDSNEGELA